MDRLRHAIVRELERATYAEALEVVAMRVVTGIRMAGFTIHDDGRGENADDLDGPAAQIRSLRGS